MDNTSENQSKQGYHQCETCPNKQMCDEQEECDNELKYNFTKWIYNELKFGKRSILMYLPFLPFIFSYFLNYDFIQKHISKITFLNFYEVSLVAQIIFIFCVIIYFLSKIQHFKLPLQDSICSFIEKSEKSDANWNTICRFNNISKNKNHEEHGKEILYEKFKDNFAAACQSINAFQVIWVMLWVNWFCYYIALLVEPKTSSSLFDIFIITETISFAACFYLLSIQNYRKGEKITKYWNGIIVVMLILALCILDLTISDDFVEANIFFGILKTLFSCTFLGLLVSALTKDTLRAPMWLKITLFFYVALQPLLFVLHDMPQLVEKDILNKLQKNSKGDPNHFIMHKKFDFIDSLIVYNSSQISFSIQYDSCSLFKKDTLIEQKQNILTKKNSKVTLANDPDIFNKLFRTLYVIKIISFNLSLILKYIFMLYVIWIIEKEHLLVYYLRSEKYEEYLRTEQKYFEAEIKKNTANKNDDRFDQFKDIDL